MRAAGRTLASSFGQGSVVLGSAKLFFSWLEGSGAEARVDFLRDNPAMLADLAVSHEPQRFVGGEGAGVEETGGNRGGTPSGEPNCAQPRQDTASERTPFVSDVRRLGEHS